MYKIRDHDEEYACTRCYYKKLYHFFFQFNLVYTTNMFCYQQTLIDRQYEIYIPGGRCFFLVAEEINVTKLYINLSLKSKKVSVYEKFLYNNIRSGGGGQGISVQHSVRMKKKNRSQIRSIRWPNADLEGSPLRKFKFLEFTLQNFRKYVSDTPAFILQTPPENTFWIRAWEARRNGNRCCGFLLLETISYLLYELNQIFAIISG